jgi:hypothetical protein
MLVTVEVEYKTDPVTGEQIPDNNNFKKYERLGDANNNAPMQPVTPHQQPAQQQPAQQPQQNYTQPPPITEQEAAPWAQ